MEMSLSNVKEQIFILLENLNLTQLIEILNHVEKITTITTDRNESKQNSLEIRERFHAKNFLVYYDNIPLEKVKDSMSKKFDGEKINYIQLKETIIAHVECSKERKVEKSLKPLVVDGYKPILRTFGKVDYKSFVVTASINNYFNFLPLLAIFLEYPEENGARKIENFIQSELSNIKMLLFSEYTLSSYFFKFIVDLGKFRYWNDFSIIGLDSKIEEVVANYLFNFRCDLTFIIGQTLVIVEYKFRHDRQNSQKKEALNCIKLKYYVPRVLNYLKKTQENLYKTINKVNCIGIGFSNFKGQINTGIEFECFSTNTINLDIIYNSEEFKNFLKLKNNNDYVEKENFLKRKRGKDELFSFENNVVLLEDDNSLIDFYASTFPGLRQRIEKWVRSNHNYGILEEGEIKAAFTFQIMNLGQFEVMCLHLIKVGKIRNGTGKKLMAELKEKFKRIVLWSDLNSYDFFTKLNFSNQKKLGFSLQKYIEYTLKAKFCVFGFDKLELKELRNLK